MAKQWVFLRIGRTNLCGKNKYTIQLYPFLQKEQMLEDGFTFPILGNHFYSLGKKNKAKGEDKPIDLKEHFEKGDENLVIHVHPNWEGNIDLPLE